MDTGPASASTSAAPTCWWRGWAPLLLLPPAVYFGVPDDAPKWVLMWSLAVAIYGGCKWLTWRRSNVPAPAWKHLAYLLAWPGLDAPGFLRTPEPPVPPPAIGEWLFAFFKPAMGAFILFAAARHAPAESPYLIGWVGMIGIGLLLHFGFFDVLSCLWRSSGLNARPLMDWPILSTSLAEYWGRRWNTAFRDLTHRYLFRPLTPRLGSRGALFVGFVFSGIVHDAVISLPARGGYGGPTLFFLVQGIAIMIERSKPGRQAGLADGFRGWLFATIALFAPLPLLFHRPFVVGIIVPFMHAIGAL